MEIIWDCGEVSASEVRRLLSRTRKVARNTVRTLLERMEEKGWITHREEGRTFLYAAAQPREASIGQKVQEVVETVCGGSAEALVTALLDYRGLNAGELMRDPSDARPGPCDQERERGVVMSTLMRRVSGRPSTRFLPDRRSRGHAALDCGVGGCGAAAEAAGDPAPRPRLGAFCCLGDAAPGVGLHRVGLDAHRHPDSALARRRIAHGSWRLDVRLRPRHISSSRPPGLGAFLRRRRPSGGHRPPGSTLATPGLDESRPGADGVAAAPPASPQECRIGTRSPNRMVRALPGRRHAGPDRVGLRHRAPAAQPARNTWLIRRLCRASSPMRAAPLQLVVDDVGRLLGVRDGSRRSSSRGG